METWTSRDGDAIVTRDNFVFYVFGYEHPEGRVFSFLKYVPSDLRPYFQVRFLKRHWKLKDVELLRPEKLYTPQSFHRFLETFRKHLPLYVYSCPLRGKELLSVPLGLIRKVCQANVCKHFFEKKGKIDWKS
jgi:predicted nucleotidyltransferase